MRPAQRQGTCFILFSELRLEICTSDKSAPMEKLARMANMSVSGFHRHFKSITGLSPLRYHKQPRLYETQKLMLADDRHASEAALAVGYESITQFNREYRSMFGEPPSRDMANLRRQLRNSDSSQATQAHG